MQREDLIVLLTALTLAELTLLVVLAYRYYQQVQPQLAGAEQVASGLSGFLNLLEGKTAPSTTGH